MGTSEAQALLGRMWADIQRASHRRQLEAVKAAPEKHRLTRIMSEDGNTGYVYWPAGEKVSGKKTKERTSFCVAKHKNAAGVFLIWRQVDHYKKARRGWTWHQAQRFDFQWAPTKKEAREIASKKAERRKEELRAASEREATARFGGRAAGAVLVEVERRLSEHGA